MREYVRQYAKELCEILVLCLLLLLFLSLGSGFVQADVVAAVWAEARPDRFEVRNELLLKAMGRIGACSPEEAIDIWANGLKERSGAAQYSVMSTPLKEEYAKQLEENAPMWVTGISSPWVAGYWTALVQKPEENKQIHHVMFTTQSSSGPGPAYAAAVTLEKEGGYWRIVTIHADKGLEAYTGLSEH